MPKLDERVGEIQDIVIFKKSDSNQYELCGPGVPNSAIPYTLIRVTPDLLAKLNMEVQKHNRKAK